ncbi:CENP-Q, a CENPA-CAD centromere complex subunit-domain-containing protein [Annulohypoxylon bovei var. microspora]|nr:CENP-Q, a CENPA-CAD centromere complex subunit-domain-containing protein [Annulohypoxylon bovei var. microspora]
MAPEAANQKRKRGRPANASGTQATLTGQGQLATASENTREPEMDESSRPKKRGRRANAEAPSQTQPEPEASLPERAKGKRVPSPTAPPDGNREGAADEGTETANPERRKRGRPRVSNEGVEENSQSNAASENVAPKKRGRPRGADTSKDNEPEADEADDENEGNSSLLRRSGRVRRSPGSLNKGVQETAKSAGGPSKGQKPKKRGRPSLTITERPAEETEEPAPQPKKKRGRPSLNNQPPEDVEGNSASQKQPKKRTRPPSSGENATTSTKDKGKKPQRQTSQDPPDSAQEDSQQLRGRPRQSKTSPRQRQHRRSSDTQNRSSSADSSTSPPPRYRHLTTRTRRVPRNIIESKWTSLEAPALASVTSLLQAASRPVLLRVTNAQKHAHAQSALNAVANRLRSKLGRGLPFPPSTTAARREEDFEFERTISGIQGLEAALDPLLHSVELLRRERERARRDLDAEYKVLRGLGANARAEARERRERVRKMHVLVPERVERGEMDGVEVLGQGKGEEEKGKVFADLEGEELLDLAGRIASHMESMRSNMQQIDDVVLAITKNQGLLRAALQSRLDKEQLESLVLG